MSLLRALGIGAAVAAGVGGSLLALRLAIAGPARVYHRGLVAGDSLLATPVFDRSLAQLTHIPWDNVAVVGNNSSQILAQVRRAFRPRAHDVVVVSAGANDGDRSLAYTQNNLRELSSTVRQGGADLVLFTEPPLRGYRGGNAGALQRSEASRMWTLGGQAGARRVIDLHQLLGGGAGRILSSYDSGDGLHPNREGRVAMARAVARVLGLRE